MFPFSSCGWKDCPFDHTRKCLILHFIIDSHKKPLPFIEGWNSVRYDSKSYTNYLTWSFLHSCEKSIGLTTVDSQTWGHWDLAKQWNNLSSLLSLKALHGIFLICSIIQYAFLDEKKTPCHILSISYQQSWKLANNVSN